MKISQALVEAFFRQIFANLQEEELTGVLSNAYFVQNIAKARSTFSEDAFEYHCLQVLLHKYLSGGAIDLQHFLPKSIFYPFEKEEFAKIIAAIYSALWQEFVPAQEGSFGEEVQIEEISEEAWAATKRFYQNPNLFD